MDSNSNSNSKSNKNKKIECEIYSRVCGFYRPVNQFNKGKKEEFLERKEYSIDKIFNNMKE